MGLDISLYRLIAGEVVIENGVLVDEIYNEETCEWVTINEVTLEEVAYFRKHNHLIPFFYEGRENCETVQLKREDLERYIEVAKEVIEDNSKAVDLLPTQAGFFYGSTKYNSRYFEFECLSYEIRKFQEVLDEYKDEFFYFIAWW